MREYYDLWEHFVRGLGRKGRLKEGVRRRLFHALDRRLLTRNVTRLVAQSRTIQDRLRRFGNIPSEVVYPPAPERAYRTDGYGDHVFAVSRLHPLKRIDLLVEAAGRLGADAPRLRIAGEGESLSALRARVAQLGLEGRVELLGRVSDAQLLDEYASCRAVYFAPRQEDYGFVTLEAFRSGKPVLTCTDSGGPAEIVEHERTGLVAEPTAESVAAALGRLAGETDLAPTLGVHAREEAARHRWGDVVERLLASG
jgi:glycosyltransferase involved in cell wall biosynthesis